MQAKVNHIKQNRLGMDIGVSSRALGVSPSKNKRKNKNEMSQQD